jgi:hypothetical protein
MREWFIEFLRDVGAGLAIPLYEDALTQLLGGEMSVVQDVSVVGGSGVVGKQKFRTVVPDVAFKVTALEELSAFERHARRLLEHTTLDAIQWVNVTRKCATFKTIYKN